VIQFRIYSQQGSISGLAGIAYNRSQQQSLAGFLTDEYIAELITEYQRLFENQDNIGFDGNERFLIGDAAWDFEMPRRTILIMIARNYARPSEFPPLSTLLELDMQNGPQFYQTRANRLETLLHDPSYNFTVQQQDFWRNMNSAVETPFKFGYFGGWEVIVNSLELLIFAILMVCFMVAPVFAGEYQAGTDSVILASKYGKSKLITSKFYPRLYLQYVCLRLMWPLH